MMFFNKNVILATLYLNGCWMDNPSMNKGSSTVVIGIILSLVLGLLIGVVSSPFFVKPATVTEKITFVSTSHVTRLTTQTHTETVTVTKNIPEIKYANLFDISFYKGCKIVKDALNRTFILVPKNEQSQCDIEGIVIRVPIERVVLMSATQVALLERLKELRPNILDTVVGIMWGRQYDWYFEDIKDALLSGRIKDVGGPEAPNYEEILMLNPDIVFIYAFPGMEAMSKFDELGIKYAVINEYLENDPLGRFEWIKFIATFYDLDTEAIKIFNKAEQTINSIAIKVADNKPPSIAWFSVYKGIVYAAGGESYVAKALRQLNAEYIFSNVKETSSFVTTIEELLGHANEIEIIIYPGIASSVSDILLEASGLSETSAVKLGRVYAYTPMIYQLGFYDIEGWYQDLASILHPEDFPDHQLKYFIRLS